MTSASVLILTPVKNAAEHLELYFENLYALDYPRDCLSLGFLESDSTDNTYATISERLPQLRNDFHAAGFWKRDFHFQVPPGKKRWDFTLQVERRAALARSRNFLLSKALREEDWVLWLDVDVVEYPRDVLTRLLAIGRDIVHPNCVKEYGGKSFDRNAWRDHGKKFLHDLKSEGDLVLLDSVGATMLFVRADLHREGLVFPPYLYGMKHPKARTGHHFSTDGMWTNLRRGVNGEIETEGFALMAADMGYQCWGMPNLEVRHKNA